jgi:hypothetical protein
MYSNNRSSEDKPDITYDFRYKLKINFGQECWHWGPSLLFLPFHIAYNHIHEKCDSPQITLIRRKKWPMWTVYCKLNWGSLISSFTIPCKLRPHAWANVIMKLNSHICALQINETLYNLLLGTWNDQTHSHNECVKGLRAKKLVFRFANSIDFLNRR